MKKVALCHDEESKENPQSPRSKSLCTRPKEPFATLAVYICAGLSSELRPQRPCRQMPPEVIE